MDVLTGLLMVAMMLLCIPTVAYVLVEPSYRGRWLRAPPVRVEEVPVWSGPYRSATARRWVVGEAPARAPWGVRLAAYSCFAAGQFVVLAVPAGLALVFETHGSASPVSALLLAAVAPGAFVTAQVWRCGLALLQGRRGTAARLVHATTLSALVYYATLLLVAVVAVTSRADDCELMWLPMLWAPVAMTHMAFVDAMYRRHEAAFR